MVHDDPTTDPTADRRLAALPAPVSPIPEPAPFPDPIPGIIPFGGLSTFSGASGVGKSSMVSSWMVCWRDGLPICGHPVNRPTGLGIVVCDRGWQSSQQWFSAAGFPDIPHYALTDDLNINWAQFRKPEAVIQFFTQALDRMTAWCPPGSLIVFDPLTLFISGNLIDYKSSAIGLNLLRQALAPYHFTLIGIFHQAKQKFNPRDRYLRPQDRILGSTAQLGFSDTAIYFSAPEEIGEKYFGLGWTPHNAPAEAFAFTRTRQGLFVPYDADLNALADASMRERVYACLPPDDTIVSATALLALVQSTCDLKKSQAREHLNALLAQGRLLRVGRGKYKRARPA